MKYLVSLTFTLLYCFANAQQLQKIAAYTTKDGLSSNTITYINKDFNGFYWIKTYDCLYRWDGFSFDNNTGFADTSLYQPNNITNVFISKYESFLINKKSHCKISKEKRLVSIMNPFVDYQSINADLKKTIENNNQSNVAYLKSCIADAKNTIAFWVGNSCYYIVHNHKEISFIHNNVIDEMQAYDLSNSIMFCVDTSNLVILNTSNGAYYILKEGKKIKEGILKENIPFKRFAFWGTQYLEKKTIIGLGSQILEIALDSNKGIAGRVIEKIDDYNDCVCFYYDTTNQKILIGTSASGFFEYNYKHFSNVINSKQTVDNFIYAQEIDGCRIINNQDIFKNYIKRTNPVWGWYLNGAICSINKKSILAGCISNLVVFNKQYQPKKIFNLDNGNITDFLRTDSVIYFINRSLNRYYPNNNTLKTTTLEDFPQNGAIIQAIYPSQKINSIYAVIGETLQELNLQKNTSVTIIKNIKGEVRNLFYDTTNQYFFIATRNNGCYFFKQNGSIQKLPYPINETSFNSHYVLQDKQGDYWLPTNNGLYAMLQTDFLAFAKNNNSWIAYKKFGKDDGIYNEEFNGGFRGSGLLKGDSIYLASQGGTVVFNPLIKYIQKFDGGKLVIDYIKVDDSLRESNNLLLSPDFKQIIVKIAYPFIDNKKDFIEYRILGSGDSNWVYLEKKGLIIIRNLKSGDYVLECRINHQQQKTIQLPFVIKPFWYNTWWAKMLFVLLFFSGGYIIFMWRYQTLKNKNMELIKQSQDKLFATIAHDLKSPINNFVNLSDNIRFLIEQKDFETIAAIGNEMDEKGRNINLLVSNILNWSLLQQGLLKPKKEKVLLQDILDEIVPAYRDIAEFKNIKIFANTSPKLTLVTDAHILSTILRNIIDNAVKYSSSNSIINIDSAQENNVTTINIANTTETINSKALNEIKAIFKNKIAAHPHTNSLGLGIAIIQKNIALLEGKLAIDIEENYTKFTIHLK